MNTVEIKYISPTIRAHVQQDPESKNYTLFLEKKSLFDGVWFCICSTSLLDY